MEGCPIFPKFNNEVGWISRAGVPNRVGRDIGVGLPSGVPPKTLGVELELLSEPNDTRPEVGLPYPTERLAKELPFVSLEESKLA